MSSHSFIDTDKCDKNTSPAPVWKEPPQRSLKHPTKVIKILVVDDSMSVRLALEDGLLHAGYYVLTAENGRKALEIIERTLPDFILTDVIMPEMDGIELCAALHGNPLYAHIPFVVMSTENDAGNMRRMMTYGAAAFIIKPFNIEQLILTLNKLFSYEYDLSEQKKNLKDREILHAQLLQTHKLESVGQLASGIAHEINTPTQFVMSNISFLDDAFADIEKMVETLVRDHAEKALSEDVMKNALQVADWSYLAKEIPIAIKQSREGLTRITRLVQAMKEFSHPGGGKAELVDINRIIETTATVARNEWKYSAELQLDLAPDLPGILCLASEIGQVFLNLLVNGAHAITEKLGRTPEGGKGRITITTRADGPFVTIQVTDTGCGIPDSARAKIFEPFFTTKAVGRGTGQGLAIAYDVVTRKHGGTLTFSTEVGKGTTFTVRLPILKNEE